MKSITWKEFKYFVNSEDYIILASDILIFSENPMSGDNSYLIENYELEVYESDNTEISINNGYLKLKCRDFSGNYVDFSVEVFIKLKAKKWKPWKN